MHPPSQPRVTPTTAALLRWWFNEAPERATGGVAFPAPQRQAILDTITTHEARDAESIRRKRPVHHVALTALKDQIEVTLALLIWQLLNRDAARAAGIQDIRFTNHFVLVAREAGIRGHLLDVLCGPQAVDGSGERLFKHSGVARLAHWLIPEAHRHEVYGFFRHGASYGTRHLRTATPDTPLIAVTDGRLDALECLARLPHAMVIDDETRPPFQGPEEASSTGLAWRGHLWHLASSRVGHGARVVFTSAASAG